MAFSFATIRFFAVIRQTMNAPSHSLPTEVSKTREREGLWLPLSALFPVASGEPPELDPEATRPISGKHGNHLSEKQLTGLRPDRDGRNVVALVEICGRRAQRHRIEAASY